MLARSLLGRTKNLPNWRETHPSEFAYRSGQSPSLARSLASSSSFGERESAEFLRLRVILTNVSAASPVRVRPTVARRLNKVIFPP